MECLGLHREMRSVFMTALAVTPCTDLLLALELNWGFFFKIGGLYGPKDLSSYLTDK